MKILYGLSIAAISALALLLLPSSTFAAVTHDLATTTEWNIRYDGANAGDYLSWATITTADIDDDEKKDLVISATYSGYNSRSYSGSVYIIYATLLEDISGTGNTIDLADSSNYNIRYDGAAEEHYFGGGDCTLLGKLIL